VIREIGSKKIWEQQETEKDDKTGKGPEVRKCPIEIQEKILILKLSKLK
jgi:hypothetical protein